MVRNRFEDRSGRAGLGLKRIKQLEMSPKLIWPGQIERIEFNLEQVTAIASVARSEVFWAFSEAVPLSVSDVAKSIGKSAQTVRYHVNELLKVDLLLVAEVRKRRSRVEDAYVHRALGNFTEKPPYSEEYAQQMIRGYRALLRSMADERSALIRLERVHPEMNVYDALRYWTVHLTPDAAAQAKRRLYEVIAQIEGEQSDDGIRVHIATYMAPALGETQGLYKKYTGQSMPGNDEDLSDD